MKMLSVLQGMVENEGRTAIRRAEWLRHMRDEGKIAKSKTPPSKTEGRAPKVVLGFILRATRPDSESRSLPVNL